MCARFDCFEVDLSSGDLRRSNGASVRIQPQPLQILRLLLEAGGRVVTREQVRAALWPEETFVDFEHGVNTAVKKLRQALDDSVENPKYVETLPKIGYRFIASVEWVLETENERAEQSAATMPLDGQEPSAPRRRMKLWWAIACAALVSLAVTIMLRRTEPPQRQVTPTPITERRLTANPDDTPILSGLISPDGKYLAYTDATGLYIRQVDNGETHPVSLPKDFDAVAESWFPDNIRLLVSRVEDPVQPPGLWVLSVIGGIARKITDEGSSASVSPDGSQIIFLRQNAAAHEIWLTQADGDRARRLISSKQESFSRVAWAPNGKRFAYAATKTRYYTSRSGPDTQIEVFDLLNERTIVIRSLGDRGLPRGGAALGWMQSDELIYPVREARPNQQDTNLWRQRLDPDTAQPLGDPVRMTNGRSIAVQLSFSSDGKRIALRRHAPQPDIYVADLERGGKELGTPRRLTLDERVDYAMAWTADSQSVVFYSNRDGPFHVFKQNISSTQPELLVGGEDDLYVPRLSPDGLSVVYVVRARPGGASNKAKVMRVPVAGGAPQFVLEDSGVWDLECARQPSKLCFYSKIEAGQHILFTFDPVKGKGEELRVTDSDGDTFDSSLSPNGNYVAWARNRTARKDSGIRIQSLVDGRKQDIAVPGWIEIYGLDWSADSKGFWAAAFNTRGVHALLHVGFDGEVRTVMTNQHADLEWAIPSPDGRHLAIVKDNNSSNVWLLEK